MKKLLIIYNIIFLFTGNVLLSSVHHLFAHDHHHGHDHSNAYQKHECIECVNADNNSNYISVDSEVNFSNNHINQFVLLYFDGIKFDINKSTDSRAPPFKN